MTRILLIDDEDQIRATLSAMLQVFGYEVVAAAGGKEGLELFHGQAFDLVITDILMPKMGGPETIAALRRLRPGLKIIATYGGGHPRGSNAPVTAESLGADRLLPKPITLEELRTAVTEVLKAAPDRSGEA